MIIDMPRLVLICLALGLSGVLGGWGPFMWCFLGVFAASLEVRV